MKITNKRITLLAMILVVMVVLVLSITSNERFKNIPIKSTYEIDKLLKVCYINCNGVKEYSYNSILVDLEAIQQKVAMVAEEERLAELAVEVERARIAEAERKERARLAKVELDKQREIKREEKKKAQMKSKVASRGNEVNEQWIQFEATYYSAFCNTGCTGFTALGWNVSNTIYYSGHRVIAVDPNVIPLGSLVQVKTPHETFYALAGDTGGSIKNNRIDILVDSTKTAYTLGRHPVQVRMLKTKSN